MKESDTPTLTVGRQFSCIQALYKVVFDILVFGEVVAAECDVELRAG